jgi:hypothetical protein
MGLYSGDPVIHNSRSAFPSRSLKHLYPWERDLVSNPSRGINPINAACSCAPSGGWYLWDGDWPQFHVRLGIQMLPTRISENVERQCTILINTLNTVIISGITRTDDNQIYSSLYIDYSPIY